MDSNKLQMNLTVFILLQLDTVGMTGPDNMQQRGINAGSWRPSLMIYLREIFWSNIGTICKEGLLHLSSTLLSSGKTLQPLPVITTTVFSSRLAAAL